MPTPLSPLVLEPQYRDYVWGGQRLRPGQLTAEAWVVHENDRITGGPLDGQTLAQAAGSLGENMLGRRVVSRTGANRFPLLIKLLDCASWLSLQVHPNDAQAQALEGPGQYGKTEAWHVIDAAPGAEVICGFTPGMPAEAALQSVKDGTILDFAQRVLMHTGDTIFIRPGLMHALGPGLLVYEVQQTSDITYRVFDWNRPASAGRKLHIEQSLAVLDPAIGGDPIPSTTFQDGTAAKLVTCEYFTLEMLTSETTAVPLDPQGETFHILTAIQGQAEIFANNHSQMLLNRFATVVIPANFGAYTVRGRGQTKVLKSSVE
jgi:mannose-6-phosphate isomerase